MLIPERTEKISESISNQLLKFRLEYIECSSGSCKTESTIIKALTVDIAFNKANAFMDNLRAQGLTIKFLRMVNVL